MPIAFFTRTRTGALVSRLNNDVLGAQRAFSDTLSGVVSNIVTLILTLAVMLTLSWQVTVLALVLLPIFVLPARRMGRRIAQLGREAADHNAAMSNQMTERFSAPGATLVKLFGRPDRESAEFATRARRVRDIGVRTAMVQWVFVAALTLVSALALALVYGVGGVLALAGSLPAGAVVSLALLLTRLYAPLTSLASARVEVMSALVSFERVFEVLDLEPLIAEPAAPAQLPDGPVSVEYDRVEFGYPAAEKVSLASLEEVARLDERGGETVLHDVSFTAAPGQLVALVGSSGAGKSTLASLLPRLYDTDGGAIRLSGVDVRELSFDTIRGAVGMVTQDGHLFHESVRANLLLAAPEASDAELWDALRRARLDELIGSLPDGLDTVVGERGYRLSGGERQRLTIARLLLAKPRVVILDEATAHLDSTSEAAVQEALGEALAGRTAIVIAHRLSTIRAADVILVVEDGRIVERGSHAELLAANGRYAQLHATQFADATETAA
jgi:ATP-binding cassette subfamily C protein